MHRARLTRWKRFDKETYLSKVIKNSIEKNGCWEFQGYLNSGYGRRRFNGEKMLVHRFVYQEIFGAIPEKMLICHKCDNPSCINPLHLFIGTNLDNVRDAVNKGRMNYKRILKIRWKKCPTLRKK